MADQMWHRGLGRHMGRARTGSHEKQCLIILRETFRCQGNKSWPTTTPVVTSGNPEKWVDTTQRERKAPIEQLIQCARCLKYPVFERSISDVRRIKLVVVDSMNTLFLHINVLNVSPIFYILRLCTERPQRVGLTSLTASLVTDKIIYTTL